MLRDQSENDLDLATILKQKISDAKNNESTQISAIRETLYNEYRGDLYGVEQPGKSKFVSRDIFETIEWALAATLRILFSSERPVEIRPNGPHDEGAAEQETDAVNYYLREQNESYKTMHDFLKDALMYPNAYVKVWMQDSVSEDTTEYTGIEMAGLISLLDEMEDPVIKEATFQEDNTLDVTVQDIRRRRVLRVESVAPEDMLIDTDHTELCLDEAPFVAHRCWRTVSSLLEAGYDRAVVEELAEGGGSKRPFQGSEKQNRFDDLVDTLGDGDPADPSMVELEVYDCYIRYDADGDGIAELRHVVMVDDQILEDEGISYCPFVATSSILMSHQHEGMSVGEVMRDLQKLSTALHRQLLDNIDAINVRRTFISEDAYLEGMKTKDALHDPRSQFIPVRGVPGQLIMPDTTPSVVGELLPVIEHVNNMRKVRTGVAPETTLDPTAIGESTAHAFLGAIEATSQRLELIARNFAETGLRPLFQKVHSLLRRHQDKELMLKLRGTWVPIKPSTWPERTDVKVNIGLGFNGQQKALQGLTQILQMQMSMGPLSSPKHIYNTLSKVVAASGLGHVSSFFIDPSTPEYQPPQPQPDPQMMIAQAEMQKVQIQAQAEQAKAQLSQANAQLEMAKAGSNAQLAQYQAQLDVRLKEMKIQLDALKLQQEKIKLTHEMDLDVQKLAADTALKAAQTELTHVQTVKLGAEIGKTEAETDATKREPQAPKESDNE